MDILSIRESAEDILSKYWDRLLPIDPVKLAISMGLEVYGRGGMADSSYPYSGRGVVNTDKQYIEYNTNEPLVRQRFVIAHVLGHVVLKHTSIKPEVGAFYSDEEVEQKQANAFAIELLTPAKVLINMYQGHISVKSRIINHVLYLSNKFGVSKDLMGYRLIQLNSEL